MQIFLRTNFVKYFQYSLEIQLYTLRFLYVHENLSDPAYGSLSIDAHL